MFDRVAISWIRSTVSFFARRTFGIYLSHFLLFQFYFTYAKGDFLYIDQIGAWIWFPGATIGALILSGALVWTIQKVPVLKMLSPD